MLATWTENTHVLNPCVCALRQFTSAFDAASEFVFALSKIAWIATPFVSQKNKAERSTTTKQAQQQQSKRSSQ
jgi:hypothetical protein